MNVNTKMMNLTTIEDNYFSRIFVMDSGKRLTLGEFVRKVRSEKGLSVADVSEKSGGKISTSYISKLELEPRVNPSIPKIQALAKGLGVTESEITAIVRGQNADFGNIADERFARISKGYALLSEQERKNLEPLLTAIELTIGQTENGQRTENKKGILAAEITLGDKPKNKKKTG